MKHIRYSFFAFIATCVAMVSCSKQEGNGTPADGGEVDCPVVVSVAALDADIQMQTRSSMLEYDDSLNNYNLFIYDDKGKLYRHIYSPVALPMQTVRLEKNRTYTVLALANMGQEITPFTELNTMLEYTVDSVSIQYMDRRYVPMAYRGAFSAEVGKSLYVGLERLPARLNVKFDKSKLTQQTPGYEVKSVKLKQCHNECYPFSRKEDTWLRQVVDTSQIHDGDYASAEDLVTINDGKYIQLYLFENEKGDKLSQNTDPWMKIPEALGEQLSLLCSYIEVMGTYGGEEVGCRAYLGKNSTKNFDVFRNSNDTLVIQLSDQGISSHRAPGTRNWKVIVPE